MKPLHPSTIYEFHHKCSVGSAKNLWKINGCALNPRKVCFCPTGVGSFVGKVEFKRKVRGHFFPQPAEFKVWKEPLDPREGKCSSCNATKKVLSGNTRGKQIICAYSIAANSSRWGCYKRTVIRVAHSTPKGYIKTNLNLDGHFLPTCAVSSSVNLCQRGDADRLGREIRKHFRQWSS